MEGKELGEKEVVGKELGPDEGRRLGEQVGAVEGKEEMIGRDVGKDVGLLELPPTASNCCF